MIPNFILRAFQILNKKITVSYKYMSISKKIKFFLKYIDKDLYLIKNYWISNFDEKDQMNILREKVIILRHLRS